MFGIIGAVLGTIGLVVTTGVTVFGFMQARNFTRKRLRFVEAAQSSAAPIIAGVGAALVTMPVFALVGPLLPMVSAGTAILFGAGVGAGVLAGKQDIIRGRLNP